MYYFDDGQEGKFWFAVQPTADIMDFGGDEDGVDMIHWRWEEEDLPKVNEELQKLKDQLHTSKEFIEGGWTYKKVMKTTSFTHPPKDFQAIVAKIHLGLKIRRGIKKQGSLSVEAEC
jgi:hypothetical protein